VVGAACADWLGAAPPLRPLLHALAAASYLAAAALVYRKGKLPWPKRCGGAPPLEALLAAAISLGTLGAGLTVAGYLMIGLVFFAVTAVMLAVGVLLGARAAEVLASCAKGGLHIPGHVAGGVVLLLLAVLEAVFVGF